MKLLAGPLRRLSVDRAKLAPEEGFQPILITEEGKSWKEPYSAAEVRILGPSRMVWRPKDPLENGARLWLETRSTIEILDTPSPYDVISP